MATAEQAALVLPPKDSPLAKRTEDLMGFFVPGSLSGAFSECEWDVNRAVAILTDIATSETTYNEKGKLVGGSTAKERIAAVKLLYDMSLKALGVSGHIRKVSAAGTMRNPDGSTVQAEEEVVLMHQVQMQVQVLEEQEEQVNQILFQEVQ